MQPLAAFASTMLPSNTLTCPGRVSDRARAASVARVCISMRSHARARDAHHEKRLVFLEVLLVVAEDGDETTAEEERDEVPPRMIFHGLQTKTSGGRDPKEELCREENPQEQKQEKELMQ